LGFVGGKWLLVAGKTSKGKEPRKGANVRVVKMAAKTFAAGTGDTLKGR
jgi:hypothetical protein